MLLYVYSILELLFLCSTQFVGFLHVGVCSFILSIFHDSVAVCYKNMLQLRESAQDGMKAPSAVWVIQLCHQRFSHCFHGLTWERAFSSSAVVHAATDLVSFGSFCNIKKKAF